MSPVRRSRMWQRELHKRGCWCSTVKDYSSCRTSDLGSSNFMKPIWFADDGILDSDQQLNPGADDGILDSDRQLNHAGAKCMCATSTWLCFLGMRKVKHRMEVHITS